MNPDQQLTSKARLEALGGGRFRLSGVLDAFTAPGVLEQSQLRFREPHITLDMSGVVESDSAGLALLIEWLRTTAQRGQKIEFQHIPAQILALARISEVEHLFSLEQIAERA